MVDEAELRGAPGEQVPEGDGWFILNLSDARWRNNPRFGVACGFEGDARFPDFGVNVHVLEPDQPACLYHREDQQEGFLVLRGTCRVLVEGQERALRPWDFVHCPPGTNHVFVGGPDGPCAILMIGGRPREGSEELCYPVDPLAARYGASAEAETPDPREAYAGTPPTEVVPSPWRADAP